VCFILSAHNTKHRHCIIHGAKNTIISIPVNLESLNNLSQSLLSNLEQRAPLRFRVQLPSPYSDPHKGPRHLLRRLQYEKPSLWPHSASGTYLSSTSLLHSIPGEQSQAKKSLQSFCLPVVLAHSGCVLQERNLVQGELGAVLRWCLRRNVDLELAVDVDDGHSDRGSLSLKHYAPSC
jgi:hypothetical protein